MSNQFTIQSVQTIKSILDNGGVIAYPTESVFGLGCDARNKQAVMRILSVKNRSIDKGLIVIVSSFDVLISWIDTSRFNPAQIIDYHEPCNWVVPINQDAPNWITGIHKSIAIRITTHPIAHAICEAIGYPLVSTSANLSGEKPINSYKETQMKMGGLVDSVVAGDAGGLPPCPVVDVITGKCYRA